MPLTSVTDLGAIGLVEDKEPVTLPPNAWNEMQNMRCEDRSIRSFDGSVAFAETSVDAQTIVQVKSSSSNYLVYAGGDSIYSRSDTPRPTSVGRRTRTGDGGTRVFSEVLGYSTMVWRTRSIGVGWGWPKTYPMTPRMRP